jgi:hemoglobin/transferrin/lactoferrin receptor protein
MHLRVIINYIIALLRIIRRKKIRMPSPSRKLALLVSASVLFPASFAAHAQPISTQSAGDQRREDLPIAKTAVETVVITATRAPQRAIDAPASISVITAAQLDDALAQDIKDAVRFEPGVSVRNQPARFSAALSTIGRDGNAGFNIRGLEGNRVLIQTDGIRLPDSFSFGAQLVGRGDYADLDLLKSVEILRGPASPLFGSDGLAGAVSFTTKDPEDFLGTDANFGGRARFGYSEADQGKAAGLAFAGRKGPLSGLVALTRRDPAQRPIPKTMKAKPY